MFHFVLVASLVLVACSQPTGNPPTGNPPHHGPCGHHPHGPPKCPPPGSNQELGKHGGKHHGPPPPGGPLGPVGVIYCNLTETQRTEVNTIVESGFNKTKKELKSSLDSFVSSLSTDLQNAVETEKKHFEEFKTNVTERVKSLSETAQKLFSDIDAIIADDSQTFPAEHEKIHELIEKTDKSVIQEFIENHIPLPGMCPPPPKHGKKHDNRRRH